MDRIFNKNYENRYSKCTQSPGVSQIFGGATQNTEKEIKFSGKVNQQIVGNLQSSPDKSIRYTQTYQSNVFESHGYKSDAQKFYTDHDGSAAEQYKYETPVKTGSQLNTVGRRGGAGDQNSGGKPKSQAGSEFGSSQKSWKGGDGNFKEETEWVICCQACSNDDLVRQKQEDNQYEKQRKYKEEMEIVSRSKQEMKDQWEKEAMMKEKMKREMEQDLAWRNVKKQDEKQSKLEENQSSKFVSEEITSKKQGEVQQFRVREDNRKKQLCSSLQTQINDKQTSKQVEKVTEKTLELQCTGFEFECYTRDRMIAQDERQLKRYLEEQMKDQQLDKYYGDMQSVTKPPEDKSQQIAQQSSTQQNFRRETHKRMLESSYADFQQRKQEEVTLKKKDEFELVMKFNKDLEDEREEKRYRREENVKHSQCLKDQIVLDKAKKLVEEEQRRALNTNDPREREAIIERLKEKIKKIVRCKRCQRIISQRIIEV